MILLRQVTQSDLNRSLRSSSPLRYLRALSFFFFIGTTPSPHVAVAELKLLLFSSSLRITNLREYARNGFHPLFHHSSIVHPLNGFHPLFHPLQRCNAVLGTSPNAPLGAVTSARNISKTRG